jgi:hypothetical protein
MQKFLWGGAALLVAGAASVYVVSDYIVRHPESIVARAGGALSTAAIHSNPLTVVNRATTGTDTVREDNVADESDSSPVENAENESTIEPIQVEAMPTLPGDAQEADSGNADDNAWLATIKMGQIPEWTEEWSQSDDHASCDLSSPVEMMVELVRVAREACQSAMMGCADAQDKPCCKKAAELAAMMEKFNALLREHKNKEAYALATLACELFPDSVIAHTAVAMTKMCTHPQDESCVNTANVVDAENIGVMPEEEVMDESAEPSVEMPGAEAIEGAEAITVMPEEEGMDEDIDDTVPLESMERSYYHHHYEGCPGMSGGCPYPHNTLEQAPVSIPPCEKPSKVNKPQKPECPKCGDGVSSRTSERRSFTVPFTDTMEFRPSDAGNYPVLKVGPF